MSDRGLPAELIKRPSFQNANHVLELNKAQKSKSSTEIKASILERLHADGLVPRLHRNPTWFGSLWSRALPQYTGPHRVGCTDLEIAVAKETFGHFKHKKWPDRPDSSTSLTRKNHSIWFPKLNQTVDGFLRMARRVNWLYKLVAKPIAAAAIFGTTFPAEKNGKLLLPTEKDQKWPVVLFSHGVGCSRLMYSSFCGEIASRGYVVIAIEHRDGSGPSTTVELEDGSVKILDWLDWQDLDWPELKEQPKDDNTLRHEQLKLRLAEIHQVIQFLRKAEKSEKTTMVTKTEINLNRWVSHMDLNRIFMTGHSCWSTLMHYIVCELSNYKPHLVGGTLALAAGADPRFDFEAIVAFDPAVERLMPWKGHISKSVLCINSEEFTLGKDYQRLLKLSETCDDAAIFSITGSTHPSFSDIHLILPNFVNRKIGLRTEAHLVLDTAIEATSVFFKKQSLSYVRPMADMLVYSTPSRPMPAPGTILLYDARENVQSVANMSRQASVALDMDNVERILSR